MAGHSKYNNIKHRKNAQDIKRVKKFTKIIREINVAAKSGAQDPEFNPKLKIAIIKARNLNVPKDKIEATIKKISCNSINDEYQYIRYNAFAQDGVAIIIECLTNNKNRTAGEVRSTLTKNGGNLGETGSVEFMFDHIGQICYDSTIDQEISFFEKVIEMDPINIETQDDLYIVETKMEDLHNITQKLIDQYQKEPISAEIIWKAHVTIKIRNEEIKNKILALINLLEELDDVQEVYFNLE